MRSHALVDLDHTLFDAFHRDGMIGVTSWDEYHAASVQDSVLPDIAYLINALHNFGYTIVGLTARPEKWRNLSMQKLTEFGVAMDELLMRPDDAFQPAPEIKMKLACERFGEDLSEVALVIDDREDVCAAFRAANITVLQVTARRV